MNLAERLAQARTSATVYVRTTGRPYLIGAAVGAFLALLFAWWWYKPNTVVEPPAPARILPSGGTVLERKPDAPAPTSIKQAAKEAGGKLERAVSITVQPKTVQVPTAAGRLPAEASPSKSGEASVPATAAPDCPPVTVDLGLIRLADMTRRVVATSSDGIILSGIDIPVEMPLGRRETKWLAGGLYGPEGYGAIASRKFGPFQLGAVAIKNKRYGWGTYAVVQFNW